MFDFIPQESLVYVLPILIFLSRIFDVSLGTLRIIFVNRGLKYLAPIIGFVEVLMWLIVVGQIMKNSASLVNYVAYAAGFASGNYLVIMLEQKLAMGTTLIRVITRMQAKELIKDLREQGYRVTNVPAMANSGEVEILFLPTLRKDIKKVIDTVKRYNPNALYTVEDVRELSTWAVTPDNYDSHNWYKLGHKFFIDKRKAK